HQQFEKRWFSIVIVATRQVMAPIVSFLIMLTYPTLSDIAGLNDRLTPLIVNLLGAWIIIRFATSFVRYPQLARTIAIIVWSVAALNTFGWLNAVTDQLDAFGFQLGENRLSLLTLIKGVFAFAILLWGAMVLSRITDKQLRNLNNLTPSLQVLISKIVRILIIVIVTIIGLNTVGIDLTSLAVFSGAVGVGLGFGLQKVISNFISGIILLMDRSIKPGDVIAIDQTYGWVNKLSARHASVITRDGKEHLIPNELLITERVENWSYSDRNIRLKIPVGISYNCEPRLALKLMLEAADETPRILKFPKPNALMIGFGDSSVDLELRAWIDDPANGIRNISSDLLLNIWDKFHEHGIEIPFPQRDVNWKNEEPLRVQVESTKPPAAPKRKTASKSAAKKPVPKQTTKKEEK
ncbi:MAG: hypothetical protein CMM94_07835, partial [Rickettsiales bacterium]|nr:hypothetical protein [Rickettsiales bacterium]